MTSYEEAKEGSFDPCVHIISAADLARKEFSEPRWIISQLIPEGLTLLAGKSKVGKSWWALQIALDVAETQGRVLYLALEDTERRLKDRMQKVLGGKNAPENLELVSRARWPKLDAGGLEHVRRWYKEHPDARLVIVDTLAKVRPSRKGSATLYQDDYAALDGLKALADELGLSILVITHLRKMPDPDDSFGEVSGTMGLTGCADTILVLHRARASNLGTLHVTGRDVEDRQLKMTWNPNNGRWTPEGEAPNGGESDLSEGRKAILGLLTDKGPMSAKDIIEATGKPEGTIKSTLSRMVRDGQLVNRGGIYSVPVNGETNATPATRGSTETDATAA